MKKLQYNKKRKYGGAVERLYDYTVFAIFNNLKNIFVLK